MGEKGTGVIKAQSGAHLSASSSSSSSGTFTMTWSGVSGATRYQLNERINSGSWHSVYNGTSRSWTSSSLGNGTYAYKAYGWNEAGFGPASNQVTVTVTHVPAAPDSVTVPFIAKVGTPFIVSWSPVTGATRYELRQTLDDDGSVSTPYNGSGTAVSITLDGPEFGGFIYAARACNGAGCSGWTQAPHPVLLNPAGGPGGPIGLTEQSQAEDPP